MHFVKRHSQQTSLIFSYRKYEQLKNENRDLIAAVSRGEEALKQTRVSDSCYDPGWSG